MKEYRILVCGSRYWTKKKPIAEYLSNKKRWLVQQGFKMVVIHGGAPGADTLAGEVAKDLKVPIKAFPANWKKYGRAAGHIRNTQMLKEGKPDFVAAFHENIDESKGTKNMLEQAMKAEIPYHIFNRGAYDGH